MLINPNNLHRVGTILKAKGLKGAVKVSFEAFFLAYLSENAIPTHLFVSPKNTAAPIPYFMQTLEVGSYEIAVKFEEINSRTDAERMRGAELFFETEKIADYMADAEEEGWDFLIGYTLIDTNDIEIGTIDDIYYFNSNELAKIIYNGNEILIPLHEDLVELLDEDQKIIVMELPEGLLDL